MKSLNRTLSLVLVLAMCLGLMGIASATSFSDTTSVKYREAVDVMSTIGVINGLDTGKFDPQGNLTREQAAKIMCYLTMGKTAADGLKTSAAPFKDVAADRWSAGSIAYCVQQGIIAGNGDGTFAPTANVTGYQFAKMLLVALGYDANIEQFTGSSWSINVAKRAFANKLFSNNSSFNGNNAATREEAALYSLNLMTAKMVTYSSKGTSIVVNGTTITTGASAPAQGATSFMDTFWSSLKLTTGTDALGRAANVWTYKGLQIGKYASGADFTFTAAASGATDAAKVASMGFTGYTIKDAGTTGITPLVNNVPAGSAIKTVAQLAALTGNGKVVEVYVDSTDATLITKVVIFETYLAQITSINTTAQIVTVKTVNTSPITYTVDNAVNPTIYGILSKMAVKDYVLVTPTSGTGIANVAAPKTVTGAVTKISTTSTGAVSAVTVGGTAYSLSDKQATVGNMNSGTMSSKADVTLYLDSYGYAIYATNVTSATPFTFVVKVSQSLVNNNIVNVATGYGPDGKAQTFNTGSIKPDAGKLYSYAVATNAEVTANNSEYTLTPAVDAGATAVANQYVTPTADIGTGATLLTYGAAKVVPFASNVKFIFFGSDGVLVKDGVQKVTLGTKTVRALVTKNASDALVVSAVFVNANAEDVTGASVLYVAKASGSEYKDGIAYNTYVAYIDGAATTVMTKGAATADTFYTYAKDATTGVYTLSEYTGTSSTNAVCTKELRGAAAADYLIKSPSINNLNAANATVVDLTNSGIASAADINALTGAGKSVMFSAIYNNVSGTTGYNTVSYIFVTKIGYTITNTTASPLVPTGTNTTARYAVSVAPVAASGSTVTVYIKVLTAVAANTDTVSLTGTGVADGTTTTFTSADAVGTVKTITFTMPTNANVADLLVAAVNAA